MIKVYSKDNIPKGAVVKGPFLEVNGVIKLDYVSYSTLKPGEKLVWFYEEKKVQAESKD